MSCLFNSLSHFIDNSSYHIRQKICDYLEQNQPIIDGLETSTILALENNGTPAQYITNMRSMSTWGGAIEIQAACNIWKLSINVKNYRDAGNKTISFVPIAGSYDRIISVYWTGGHYEPIRDS